MADPKSLTFQGTETHAVSALWLRPRGARAGLVLGHGAGAGMRHGFMESVAHGLAERKIATFRYQFPYMEAGRRSPDRPNVATACIRNATIAAAKLARGLPLFAGGKSFGGRMTTLAQAEEPLPGIRGLVFHGFPLHSPARKGNERAAHLPDIEVPMLFIQGTRDKLCELDLLAPVLKKLGKGATLHVVESADHGFHVPKKSGRTDDDALEELMDATASWMVDVSA